MWLSGWEIERPVVISGCGEDPKILSVCQGRNGDSCGYVSSQPPSWAAAADHEDESSPTLLLVSDWYALHSLKKMLLLKTKDLLFVQNSLIMKAIN